MIKLLSWLNSDETLISYALTDMEISHEEFITISNEKDKYEKMKNNLISKNEKLYKIMRLSGVKWLNAFLKNSFSTYKMESYCLKCKKNTKNKNPKISSISNGRAMLLSKYVQYVAVKNQDLLKIKKQKDY